MRSTLEYLFEKALIFWAYGHLFVGNYKEGLDDLTEAKQINALDQASDYNLVISQAVICNQSGDLWASFDLCNMAK